MAIRAKTKRRLFILLGSMAAVVALAAAVYMVRMAQIRQETLAARDTGMAAVEQGDHFTAMHELGKYLQRHPEDAEVTYLYASARLKVEEPDGRHLVDGARSLRRALELKPDDTKIRRELLDVYQRIGFSNETIALAREILAEDPDNTEALRAQFRALIRLRMYDEIDTLAQRYLERDEQGEYIASEDLVLEALRAQAIALHQQSRYPSALPMAEAFNERRPDDYQMRRLTLDLMHALDRPSQQLLEYVRELREAYPEHPGFAVLEARTLRRFGRTDAARQAIADATASDLGEADDIVVMDVLNELDQQQLFGQTVEVMQRVASQMDNLRFRQVMAQRLAMAQQWDALLEHFGELEETPERGDTTLLAMVALARFEQGADDDAEAILEELRTRVNDGRAIEWATVLSAVHGAAEPSPRDVIEAVQRASQEEGPNPFFQHWVARAYHEIGEVDLAIAAWQRATEAAPYWTTPLLESARVLAKVGRTREAKGVAQLALRRSPHDVRAGLVLAEVVWADRDALSSDEVAQLRQLLSQLQQAMPFEPRSLVLQVRVLAASGEAEAARDRVAEALAAEATLPPAARVQLAEIMASIAEADLEQRLLDGLDTAAQSPEGASRQRQVRALMDRNDLDAAMKIVREQVASTDGDERRQWRVLEARLLEQQDDAEALPAWRALVRDYPDALAVHRRVLDSSLAWRDRELVDTAIEGVRRLAGEEALSWRVARARWLLEGTPDQRQDSEIVDLLQHVLETSSQHVQARLLMARYYEQTGNTSAAVDQITRVVESRPDRGDLRLHLARLLREDGDTTQAQIHLDQVTRRSEAMSPDERVQSALMLVRQGELARAIGLLEPHQGESSRQDLMLAELLARAGRLDEAGQLYDRLLEHPSRSVVESASRFFAATQQTDRGQAALAKLDELTLPPGEAALIRGNYHAAARQPARAREAYAEAVEAAPENVTAWRRRMAYAVLMEDVDAALAMLSEAAEATDDALLDELASQRDAMQAAAAARAGREVLIALLSDPAAHEPGMQVVSALSAVDEPAEALARLEGIAEAHPQFLAAQMLVYRLHMERGAHDEAVALAQRMVQTAPGASEPAWMLAEALSAAGRWEEAMEVAQQSAAQGSVAVAQADQLIAEAQMQLGESASALRRIEPYLDEALAEPDTYMPLIVRAARAMLRADEADRARQMLEPLLERSARWRAVWLQLAVAGVEDEAEAARWLERLEETIPADERGERFDLARGWWALLDRTGSDEYREAVRRTLTPLTELDPPMPEAVMGLAVLEDAAGNDEAAEQGYREALSLQEELPIAANNLSVILFERGEKLDEAVSLAREAVSAAPRHAPFRHTLAQALERRGDDDEALQQMRRAVELEPSNPRWSVALAELLLNQEQFDAAGEVLAGIDEQFPDGENVPEDVREELESVRSQWNERQRSSDATAEPEATVR